MFKSLVKPFKPKCHIMILAELRINGLLVTHLILLELFGLVTTKRTGQHYLPNSSSNTVVPIFRAIMEGALPYVPEAQFDVVSVNDQLANPEKTSEQVIQETTEEVKKQAQKVKKKAAEIEEIIIEESPKWKQNFEEGVQLLFEIGKSIKDSIKNI